METRSDWISLDESAGATTPGEARRSFTGVAGATLALWLAGPAPATAQLANATAPDVALEEITVTARKIEESLDRVPLAITALTAAGIEARHIQTIEEVAAFSPGFFMNANTTTGQGRNDRSFRQLTFRGVGANSTNTQVFAGGLAFLDGAPVLNSALANVQDVERVEVLRGPQSAYFGRSTFLGAVNYITKNPADSWERRVSAEWSERGSRDVSATLSGPLIEERLGLRVGARHFERAGQYQTWNEGVSLGDQGTDSISLTLQWAPVEALRVRGMLNYFEDEDGPPAQYTLGGRTLGPGGSNCNLGGTLGPYYCGEIPQEADPQLVSGNYTLTPYIYEALIGNRSTVGLGATGPQPFDLPFQYAGFLDEFGLRRAAFQSSLRVDYALDNGMTLNSTSAFHREKVLTVANTAFRDTSTIAAPAVNPPDAPAFGFYSASVGYDGWDFSQELRLVSSQEKRLRYLVGANFIKLHQSTSGIVSISRNAILRGGGVRIGHTEASTPAIFAGIYFDLHDRLTLSAEGRYQEDEITSRAFAAAASAPNDPNAGRFIEANRKFGSFSPKLTLDYELSPTSTAFALASRGYKPGGFNNFLVTQTPFIVAQVANVGAAVVYDQEQLDNIEVGIKGSFLDGRARASLNLYHGDYSGVQINIPTQYYLLPTVPGGSIPDVTGPSNVVPLFRNAGAVTLRGIEAEGEFRVTPGLRIGATFALNDSEMKSFFYNEAANFLRDPAGSAPGTIRSIAAVGKQLPGAPRITGTLSLNYERAAFGEYRAFAGGDYVYRGSYFVDNANVAETGDQEMVNVRLGVRSDRLQVELFARNLLDDQSPGATYAAGDTFNLAGGSGNSIRIALPDRRRFGVRVAVDF